MVNRSQPASDRISPCIELKPKIASIVNPNPYLVAERCAHDDGRVSEFFVVRVYLADADDAGVSSACERLHTSERARTLHNIGGIGRIKTRQWRSARVCMHLSWVILDVPIENASDKGGYKSAPKLGSSDSLSH